ncbi:hypothetical protein JXA47_13085, partial [Candidatus Sumerlaeota bacterium]|nr:hypothetical protein [Candidatus Sumerlaeota bacterium]
TVTLVNIDSFRLSRNDLRLDDIRLADARTTRVFTLAPSALAGIISVRDVTLTGPNTDTWYHYDRLGNLMLTTDSDGDSNGLRWQDAYGNQLASLTDGSWASAPVSGTSAGFISKPFDGDIEFTYGHHRWYDPQLGRYISRDRASSFDPDYPDFIPSRLHDDSLSHPHVNPYLYAHANPNSYVDIDGNAAAFVGAIVVVTIGSLVVILILGIGNNSQVIVQCNSGCINNSAGTAGAGSNPLYTPRPGAPARCANVLCRALTVYYGTPNDAESPNRDVGIANSYIQYWNTYCAGPGAQIPYFQSPWGSRPVGIPEGNTDTPWLPW